MIDFILAWYHRKYGDLKDWPQVGFTQGIRFVRSFRALDSNHTWAIALHEAGHLTAAKLLKAPVSGGLLLDKSGPEWGQSFVALDAVDPYSRIIILLAAGAAEIVVGSRKSKKHVLEGMRGDLSIAFSIAKGLLPQYSNRQLFRELRSEFKVAQNLLKSNLELLNLIHGHLMVKHHVRIYLNAYV